MNTRTRHTAATVETSQGREAGHAVVSGRVRLTAPARPAWLDDDLYPFESRYLTLEGNHIHHIDEGTGPVLLFLHANPLWSFQYRTIIKGLRDMPVLLPYADGDPT